MTNLILMTLALYVVHTFIPGLCLYLFRKEPLFGELLGTRDNPPEPSVYAERAGRALKNMQEAMFVFLPLALLAGDEPMAVAGATLFFWARVAYLPVYVFGIPVLRSVIWVVGLVGIVRMAMSVVGQL